MPLVSFGWQVRALCIAEAELRRHGQRQLKPSAEVVDGGQLQ